MQIADTSATTPRPNTILDLLSFEAGSNMALSSRSQIQMQGVLWKRRDFFTSRWRPRWFVLHPDQYILTYYLLTNQEGRGPQQVTPGRGAAGAYSNQLNSGANRRRTFSESSNVSENTIDYDVVPRGTIYLQGSTVEANEALTRPEEELYVLTISDHENAAHCHLAARTIEARDQWISHIRRVCQRRPRQHHHVLETPREEDSTDFRTPPRSNGYRRTTSFSPSTPAFDQPLVESSSGISNIADQRTGPSSQNGSPSSDLSWKVLYRPNLFEGVPEDLRSQIEKILITHLPYVEDKDHPDWKFRYESNGIYCSQHIQKPMIRSIRRGIQNHHPIEYLQISQDLSHAEAYETNVRTQSLLKAYNSHVSLVYKSYEPIWPTSSRDFATAAFWALLERNKDERAICLVAFSCDEADELKPVDTWHVRGTLNVALNFWCLKDDGCFHSRIISYDLRGNILPRITKTILEQQACIPRVMDIYLTKLKEQQSAFPNIDFKMEYNSIYKILRALGGRRNESEKSLQHEINRTESVVTSLSGTTKQHQSKRNVNLSREALFLLCPLLIQKVISMLSYRLGVLCFVVTSVLALRWVILQQLLSIFRVVPDASYNNSQMTKLSSHGATCCRFTVDLKGVLRFLANEKEAKTQQGQNGVEILVTHILVRCLAKAMNELPHLISREFPLLPSLYSVDVVVHDHQTKSSIWVNDADEMRIQEIANWFENKRTDSTTTLQGIIGPTCHLFTTPDSDHSQVDIDLNLLDVPVAVCVSGIRLGKEKQTASLSVSINIQSTDIEECRAFAEKVQQLLQFPEMLE